MWRHTDNVVEMPRTEDGFGRTKADVARRQPRPLTAGLSRIALAEPRHAPGFPAQLARAIAGDALADRPINLSPRETECLAWTARGKTTWEIAQILCLSDSTVNYYLRNAMKKLSVHTKAHAVSKAVVLGLFG